jgi:hypothetical protein
MASASGSATTVAASANETPCFFRFEAALHSSQETFTRRKCNTFDDAAQPAPPHNRSTSQQSAATVGSYEAGENLAGLYSLIATCETNGVNPVDYLADVLLRVQSHPASRIDELLPQNWTPPRSEPSA